MPATLLFADIMDLTTALMLSKFALQTTTIVHTCYMTYTKASKVLKLVTWFIPKKTDLESSYVFLEVIPK